MFYQIVKAVSYIHSKGIIHRDLKLQNILTNDKGQIKITDFGLARQYGILLKPYTHEVCTLWYRPPEILLGSEEYSTPVDSWSLGCILAEIFSSNPLFPGDSEISMLFKIFEYF